LSFLVLSIVGVPADSLVPAKGSLVSKGSTRRQLLFVQTEGDIPAAGPKFVTPAVEAGAALGFFVVASTLGLVVAICQLDFSRTAKADILVVLIKCLDVSELFVCCIERVMKRECIRDMLSLSHQSFTIEVMAEPNGTESNYCRREYECGDS
jgi:hypothetical protein